MSNPVAGPWHVNVNPKSATVCAVDHGKSYTVGTFDNKKFTHEANVANATLCAAAPNLLSSMLKAVTLLCVEYPRDQWPDRDIDQMLVAIALAQGCTIDDVLQQIGEK